MNKRLLLTSCIVLSIIMTSGCTGENGFSAKEEAVLADYLAKKVLKHSKGYNYRLVEIYNSPFIRQEIDESNVDIDLTLEEDTTQEDVKQEDTNKEDSVTQENTTSSEDLEGQKSVSIGEALGFDEKITVKVINTKVVDDISKGAYYLEAKNGDKLVKIDMKITNTSSEKLKVKFKNSKCTLVIGSKEYSPLLTALEDDLQFLSSKIDKKKSLTASLVFSVDEDDAKKDKSVKFKTDNIQTTASLN